MNLETATAIAIRAMQKDGGPEALEARAVIQAAYGAKQPTFDERQARAREETRDRPPQQSADDRTVTVAMIAHEVSQAIKYLELCRDAEARKRSRMITSLVMDIVPREYRPAVLRYVRAFCENLTGDDVDRIARMPATIELREALK